MVVSPSKMLRKPSSRKVTMPSSTAFCRTTTVGRALVDERADGVADDEQLKNALAALVTGVVAGRNSRGHNETPCRPDRAAKGSSSANCCSVGSNGVRQFLQMVRTSRWPSTAISVEEIRNGSTPMSTRRVTAPGRIVGVQRAQDQVARQRRLNGNLRRFQVAHFPHHDDVRVLAQKRPQRLAEGHARRPR